MNLLLYIFSQHVSVFLCCLDDTLPLCKEKLPKAFRYIAAILVWIRIADKAKGHPEE